MANWYQQSLTPAEVLELNIRLGVIPSENHCQALVELQDPRTRILVAQWSAPHALLRDTHLLLDEAVARAKRWLDDATEPF